MTLLTSYLEEINPRLTMARALGYDYALARVVKVVDGDTVDLQLNLGFRLTFEDRFRLLDVDTPERGQLRWDEARLFVIDWLLAHQGLRVTTLKTDKYGRWLAYIYDPLHAADLSADLLNHEVLWRY